MLQTLLMMYLVTYQPTHGMNTHSKMPVLWRKSLTPVVNGYFTFELRIILVDPCKLMKKGIAQDDLLNRATQECNRKYKADFLDYLTEMCPHEKSSWNKPNTRVKRVIPLVIIGGVVLVVAVVAGVGVAATAMVKANENEHRLEELEGRYSTLVENIRILEKQYNNVSQVINDVIGRFNQTVLHLNELERNFTMFRDEYIDQAWTISSTVAHLSMGKAVMTETIRAWRQGKLHLPFLDYMNVTLPCGNACALDFIRPDSCEYDNKRGELYLAFDTPIVSDTFMLMNADAFQLMKRTKNETCTLDYDGPSQAVVSTNEDCIQPLTNQHPTTSEIMVYPMDNCDQEDFHKKRIRSYKVSKCEATTENDHLHFIQTKREGSQIFIYCPYSTIKIGSKEEPCPNHVFSLPLKSEFQINNVKYNTSLVKIKIVDTWAPLHTSRANWYLFDHHELDHLMIPANDTLGIHEVTLHEMKPIHEYSAHNPYTLVGIILFGLFLVLFLGIKAICKKRGYKKIIVRAVPQEDNEIEMAAVPMQPNEPTP